MGIYRICLFTFFIPCTKMLMIISRIYAGLRACSNKSMMRKVGQRMSQRGVPARFHSASGGFCISRTKFRKRYAAVLEAPRRKLPEDHLGEAPIKPGDSVTVLKKVAAEDF